MLVTKLLKQYLTKTEDSLATTKSVMESGKIDEATIAYCKAKCADLEVTRDDLHIALLQRGETV